MKTYTLLLMLLGADGTVIVRPSHHADFIACAIAADAARVTPRTVDAIITCVPEGAALEMSPAGDGKGGKGPVS